MDDACADDVAWSEGLVHFDLVSLEVAHVFLLDNDHKHRYDWVAIYCKDVHFAETVLDFGDTTIYFFVIQRLAC